MYLIKIFLLRRTTWGEFFFTRLCKLQVTRHLQNLLIRFSEVLQRSIKRKTFGLDCIWGQKKFRKVNEARDCIQEEFVLFMLTKLSISNLVHSIYIAKWLIVNCWLDIVKSLKFQKTASVKSLAPYHSRPLHPKLY